MDNITSNSRLEIIDQHLERIERINQLNDSANEYKNELRSIIINNLRDSIGEQIVSNKSLAKKAYYTVKEAEELLGVEEQTIYRYIDTLGIEWDRSKFRNKLLINSVDMSKLIDLAAWAKKNRGRRLDGYFSQTNKLGIITDNEKR